jgi:ABC-type uncharacterized transport system permease subunit
MKRALLTLLTLVFLTSLACSMSAYGVPTPTPNDPKPVVRNTPNALVTVEVTADEALHVRNQPLGVVLGYLYHADSVTLTNKCSTDPAGWAEIAWQGGTAWVAARYLSDNICEEQ